MSKHFFTSGNYHIDAGYDRPMRHFYLNITDTTKNEDEDLVYISMYDSSLLKRERGALMGGMSLDELSAKFTELDITPPTGFLDALDSDARRQAGNEVTTWESGGPVRRM